MAKSVTQPGWSLRTRLALGLLLTALLPALLFSAAVLWSQWRRDQQELHLQLDANARLNASLIDDFLESQQAGVRLMAEQAADLEDVRSKELVRLLQIYPAMLRALHVDANGQVTRMRDTRLRERPPAGLNVAEEEWFKAAKRQYGAAMTDVFRRPIYGDEAVGSRCRLS